MPSACPPAWRAGIAFLAVRRCVRRGSAQGPAEETEAAAGHRRHQGGPRPETVAPIATRLAEATRLERELSAVVNAAYKITPEEEALIWRTAPPRMPSAAPQSTCGTPDIASASHPSRLSSPAPSTKDKVKSASPLREDPVVQGGHPPFAEFSRVTLKRPVEVQGVSLPAGAQGVIMGIYADGLAYEVEFDSPHAVLTIEQADLQE